MTKTKGLVTLLLVGLVVGLVAISLTQKRTVRPAYANPIRVEIIDPDRDDIAGLQFKTRPNTDGTARGHVEAEISPVVPGQQYTIRVEVFDVSTGQSFEATTPNLVAQPPQ